MKRISILSVMILLLTVSLIMTACGNKATEGSQTTNENAESDTLSEELKEQILNDYIIFRHGDEYDPKVEGRPEIEEYYGTYDDAVAVMINFGGYTQAIWTDHVAGTWIHYWDGNQICIWYDGDFFTVKEAYEKEILIKEEVWEIAALHNKLKLDVDPLSDELAEQIINDYTVYMQKNHNYVLDADDPFYIQRYYGNYGGIEAVMICGGGIDYSGEGWTEEVGFTYKIRYEDKNRILFWVHGEFFTLEEIWQSGHGIGEIEVDTIARIHDGQLYIEY